MAEPRPKPIVGKVGAGTVLTRPANTTAYASGDAILASATAGDNNLANSVFVFENAVRVTGYRGRVRRAGLKASGTAITNGSFRLHIFDRNPLASAPGAGDNAGISLASNAGYLGSIDITLSLGGAGGCGGWGTGEINFLSENSTNLYGILEARAAYTPASEETFAVTIDIDQY